MPKTATDLARHALNGPTMGTRWSALFFARPGFDPAPVAMALQAAVDEVDGQMSPWKPDSALMRFNRAPAGDWVALPAQMMAVLTLALEIGRASGGAFDIGVGDAVGAWGFGPDEASPDLIRAALSANRQPAHDVIEIREGRARKLAPITLDLNGIAKGHGADRLAETLERHGIHAGLVGIDGEMRAAGLRPDGEAWTVAIEEPASDRRAAHSVLSLHDAAVATSGDYRHWVDVGSRRLSHTMDPQRGAPVACPPASVTVLSRSCAAADAWATALMVLGSHRGTALAHRLGLDVLFLDRQPHGGIAAVGAGAFAA